MSIFVMNLFFVYISLDSYIVFLNIVDLVNNNIFAVYRDIRELPMNI